MSSPYALLGASNSGSGFGSLVFFIPLIAIAYFLLIRPQRRRQKETMTLQRQLSEGDEVITTSGLYGFITGFDGDVVWLEIDDNVQIRVSRGAVARRVDTSSTPEEPTNSTAIDDIIKDDASDK